MRSGTFGDAVLRAIRRIPRGRVATYGDVADMVGRPGAARAVARVLRAADGSGVPYHRVVGADGRVGGARTGDEGWRDRAARLRREGVRVAADGRIEDFGQLRYRPRTANDANSAKAKGRIRGFRGPV